MLSVSSIGSAGGAANYYGKDDYYVSGEAGEAGAVWGGKGAEQAGLSGKAEVGEFQAVLGGKHDAILNGEKPDLDKKHHPGWDLTFSAPKSVSVAILVGGDKELLAIHKASVKAVMDYAEKHFAATRIREEGQVKEVLTGNLVYATVTHETSRKGDPNIHDHAVVANATYHEPSGQWRAVESLPMFKHIKFMGEMYRQEMAKGAMALGYDIETNRKDGTFELAGFSKDQLTVFSKRRSDIEQSFEIEKAKHGTLTSNQRDRVVMKDRPKKIDVPRDQLSSRWKQEAKAAGMDVDRVVQGAGERALKDRSGLDVTPERTGLQSPENFFSRLWADLKGAMTPRPEKYVGDLARPGSDGAARSAVALSVQMAEQGKAVFSKHELIAGAFRFGPAGMGVARVEAQLKQLSEEKHLQGADLKTHFGLTTATALAIERSVVAEVERGKGLATPLMSPEAAQQRLDALQSDPKSPITLNEGQIKSGLMLLTSPDRFVAVQGFAGVGKTTMFKIVQEAAKSVGPGFAGQAPTHSAAAVLTKDAGIASTTMESWLNNVERALNRGGVAAQRMTDKWSGRTILTDESSMVSNAQIERVMKAARALNLERIVMVGDQKQLGSPEAGAAFRLMLTAGVQRAEMTQIVRQKDEQLRAAVTDLAQSKIGSAFRKMDQWVVQVGREAGDTALTKAAVEQWKTFREEGGVMPAVIVPTNALRGEVSAAIRQVLIKSQELGSTGIMQRALSPLRLTNAEQGRAQSYQEGQVMVAHSASRRLGLAKDQELKIVGRDTGANTLTLMDRAGRIVSVDLQKDVKGSKGRLAPYMERQIEVRAKELMVWDKTDKDRGVKVGERFEVLGTGKTWTVKMADGEIRSIPANDPILKFVSHGYAETADRAQGSTYKDVVAILSSKHGEATTEARAYVQASRASERLAFVTNDVRTLMMKLNKQDGQNAIASLELSNVVERLKDAFGMKGPTQPGKEVGKVENVPEKEMDITKSKSSDKGMSL